MLSFKTSVRSYAPRAHLSSYARSTPVSVSSSSTSSASWSFTSTALSFSGSCICARDMIVRVLPTMTGGNKAQTRSPGNQSTSKYSPRAVRPAAALFLFGRAFIKRWSGSCGRVHFPATGIQTRPGGRPGAQQARSLRIITRGKVQQGAPNPDGGCARGTGAGSMTRGELSCRWRPWPYMYESPMSDPWCWNVSEVEIIDDLRVSVNIMNNMMIVK